jgi:serine/threonine protein kinase
VLPLSSLAALKRLGQGTWRRKGMRIDPKQWPTLSRLLDEALEMPSEGRERWLESLPPPDIAYREDLRSLLRHADAAETHEFLDILPDLREAVESARAAVSITALKPGAGVGPYVIEREIGSGGMGAVWLARRSDGLIKRPVALKLPHTGPPHGHHLAERFASERDILAELAHPNIARLYDAGFSDDGQPFLALEYVAGAPLIEYCDQHRLDLQQRLRLFQQVLHAVQYAHGNLVIHRDLKPSNVIVGNGGRAMLLDFGIAKLIAIDPREENSGAQAGAAGAGLTPDYASPEQIAGQGVTTASDIYSLGVLLFELLTGERPHKAAESAGSRAELEQAILTLDPQKPSESVTEAAAGARGCTIRSLSRALQGDLDTITLKALKKAPVERYATADALSEDIERYLEGEPIAARRDGGWYLARKFIARHKASVVGAGIAMAAIVATAAIALYEAHAAAGHARVAAAERDRALALSSRNEAIADFLDVLITESAGSGQPAAISDMLARSEALVSAEFRGNREHRAAVLDMVGSYYDATGNPKRSLELYDGILRTAAQTNPAALPSVVIVANRARALELIGRYAEARDAYNRCIELSLRGELTNMRLRCMTGLAWVARELGDVQLADRYLREASDMARTTGLGSELTTLKIARGRIALANNQLAEARTNLDAAIADGNTVFYQMTALVPRAELNLNEGRLAEAEADARRALSLARNAQGGVAYSNRTGLSWLVLGRVLGKKGDAAGSEQALRSALEHLSNTVDANHPMLLLARQLALGLPPAGE